MKWVAVLVVVAIAIDGLPALNLPGASSDADKEQTSSATDVGVGVSKADGVANQQSGIGNTVSQKTPHNDGTTIQREFLSELGEGIEDSDEISSHTANSDQGQGGIGSGNQGLFDSGIQARSSQAHRGPLRPISHIPNHGPSETHAHNQHRNYASENGHYGSQTRKHGGASRHIGNFGTHNDGHRNGFWNHAHNSEQLARGAGHHRNNHFVSGKGIRHQRGKSADYGNHANDGSQFSEGGYQGADASEDSNSVRNHRVNIVDSASDTENQETNSGEYDSGNVSDESESSSGYVDESFRRGLGKGVNTDKFVSEPENEGDNSGQYGSKYQGAVEAGDLREVLKRGLNKPHFISATGNHAHSGKYNTIARHGNGYQDNANGDLRGFLNRPHFGNQRVNPGKHINGIFDPTDNVNYWSGNGYHSSLNEYLNGLLNRARGRLSHPRPVNPRPVPSKYINGGFAQGGHNDQYDIEDDEEESQDANEKYISDILTQAQHLLKLGAVPNSYGVTPAHHHPSPQRRPVYETPNLGIRLYDAAAGSYMANPASTADDDDTYGEVAPGYVVPAVIVPEFNGYPTGQYYGPNYYRNGGFGSGPSYIPGIDRSGPTTIFGRNPPILPLSTIPVSNAANLDNTVVIDKTLTFEPLPPLNPFKPLSPLTSLTPWTTFDTDYEGTSGDASEITIDNDLLRATFETASSLKKDGTTSVINKDLTSKITHTTHPDSYNDENSKISNGAPSDKTVLPKQTDKPVKGNEKIDEASVKITKEKTDDKLVATGKDGDKIIKPGKSIITDKTTVTKHIYNHGDISKKDKTVTSIEKVLETNEKSEPTEKKDDGTIKYDKSNEKTTTKKGSDKDYKPNSNDNDEISKTGKPFVVDKTLVIKTINKDKSGKENINHTSTKTREISGTESKPETLDKSHEGITTNGKSIVIDETTVIKLTGKDLKDFGQNDKAVEEVTRDLRKDGSHVIGKADDKTTKHVKSIVDKAIVIQNDLGTADKSNITNNDGSTKNGKTSDKTTEIKIAVKDGNVTDKKDKTLGKYDKSDGIGKINDGITKNVKSIVTEDTDNKGKDNVKTLKTDANVEKALDTDKTSRLVDNSDAVSIKNGESIGIDKTTVIKTIHKDESGTETIGETSTEIKEVSGNDGKSDFNDKSDYETTKNSKSKENKGLKNSDSKTDDKIDKTFRKHDKPDDIGKDNDENTKLLKTIVFGKANVIKNFTGIDDDESTKKGKSNLTEDTDKQGQDKNKTDKTIEKIYEKDDRSDAIDKKNDDVTKNGKSIGIKNTTLIKKESRKDDKNNDYEETTKNGKSTVAEKSRGVKNEKITEKVSGTDDESSKNNDIYKTTPGKSTVTDNSSGVKNADNDGDDETPEGGKLKGTNIKSVTKSIKKDRSSKDDKLTEYDKTSQFKNNNGYTTNNDKKNDINRATKKAVGSGNSNGPSDEDFHDDADNVKYGKDGKHGNNGNKNENKSSEIGKGLRRKGQKNGHGIDSANSENNVDSADGKKPVSDENGHDENNVGKEDKSESDGNSFNEDSFDNENDVSSKSGKSGKSGSHGSNKNKKEVESYKSDSGSINEDSVDNETYSKVVKSQSKDDKNVVESQKEDALGKSDKKDENSTKTDKVDGRKNDHESDFENIGYDTTSEDDKLTGITKKTVSVKTSQVDNTDGSQDQSESSDDSSNGSNYEDSSSSDRDDAEDYLFNKTRITSKTDKGLEQNDDKTEYDDNDDTSNDEQHENGSEFGDDSNNEDREDNDENDLFGKSDRDGKSGSNDDKKVVGSENGGNKDSNENYEDASSNSGKSDESGKSGGQKDNKVENDDAPEKSDEEGKSRNPGDKKVVGSENGETQNSDKNDNDVSSNSGKSGESGNTGDKNDKTVVGSENNDTPKKSGENAKTGNNIDKKDEKVVEPDRNNKDFHENDKVASSNSEEDGKSERKRGHKRINHIKIGKKLSHKKNHEIDSTKRENDETSKHDILTVTSEKPKPGQDENKNINAGDGYIKKGSDNNDDENTSDKSVKTVISKKKHGLKRRIHTKIGTVADHKKNHEILKDDILTVTIENPKPGQDENNDSKKDRSKPKDRDDDNETGQSVKGTKSRKNDGQKHKIIKKIGTTVVNKNVHETDESKVINEKPKKTSSRDENNNTKHDDSSIKEDFDANDDDNNKRNTSEKINHKPKHLNKIDNILGPKNDHEIESTDSEDNEAPKNVKSTGNKDNQVSDKTDQDESNDAKENEGKKKIKKVIESGDDSNNDDDDIITGRSDKGDESGGKGDKNDGQNLESESGEIVDLDEDASENSKKEIHGKKHKKSHKFVGRKGQKKYQETDLSTNNNNETSVGVKPTEKNEKPVFNKPGQGKNISDKKAATEKKINRNHDYENGKDTNGEDSDKDDDGKLSDNSGKGGKFGSNGGIKDKKHAGFQNDYAPEKSEKGSNRGRYGSNQDKAVGPEAGDNRTPNEHDDDAAVAEKGERILGKKHKKSQKVVRRKGHKKDQETDLLNIDKNETSKGVKTTDINKKSASDEPGQEENKNDENEETEKKINRNHRSKNGEDRENSDDDEVELSKNSGKGRRYVQKDKKVGVSDNDDAPEKSEGGKPGRHGGKQDKAVETESSNKEYSKEHDDDDKGAAEKSNKGGRIHGKKHKHSHNVHKVVKRKGLKNDHVTDSADNENDEASKQVKSTVDSKIPVSDENSEDQKVETVDKINEEIGFEKGDSLTNQQTEITDMKLRIRDYRRRIKNNVTKTKKDLQSRNVNGSGSNDRVEDGRKHNRDSNLTDQNTKSVKRNEKRKIRTKIVKIFRNHESGDDSDSKTTEKSKSTPNSEKVVTEEIYNNDKTSTKNDASGHEDKTSDGSNSAVNNKQSKNKKHNHRDTTYNGNKDTSSQVIRKHANTKDKERSKTDANTSKYKTSNEKDSCSDAKNNSADDNEQQDNEFDKDWTNNSNADKTADDLEQEDTTSSSDNDDAVNKSTGSENEDTSDTKNTAVTNTSKAKFKIHRRTTDTATKTRNFINRKLATITITIKEHKPKLNTEDTNNHFAGNTTADSTSGKTTETDDGLGKTEEISNRNTADNNSSDNCDEEISSSTSTDNNKEKSGSRSDETSSSSTNSDGESKTSSTNTKKDTSNNQSDESSSSSNETADRQSKDETKSKSYKNRKEEFNKSASGAKQESINKDGKKTTYKKSSENSAHSEQQEDSKYTEESSDSEGKTVQSEQRSDSEEGNNNSSDSYIEESDGETKKSKKDSASEEDKKNQASFSSEYKKVDSNRNTEARKSSSRRKSFKSKQSSSTEEEYSSSS